MSNKVKTMIKDVIEENAVNFKTNASNALYEKVGNKLQKKYVELSNQLIKGPEGYIKNETNN
jgi:hypothetical protein